MNNSKVGKGKLSITKKKINYQKSRPKITRPATAKVKSSETSRDLNGYLEPLTICVQFLNESLFEARK